MNEDRAAKRIINPLHVGPHDTRTLLGGWCHPPSSFSAELVARSGVDYVVVDMQHGLAAYSDLVAMLQGTDASDSVLLVRVPAQEFGLAQRALDAGALGVIFPMVNSREQAVAAARTCRYPPLGERSFGPIRAKLRFGTDRSWADAQVLCLGQIETREAVANLEGILSIEGVYGVYVGPADLALSHGLPIGGRSAEFDALLTHMWRHARGTVASRASMRLPRRALERSSGLGTECVRSEVMPLGCPRVLATDRRCAPG